MVDGVETEDCAFYLGEKSLYDSVTIATTVAGYPGSGLSLPGAVSAAHVIGAAWIPLLQPVLVRLRPMHPVLTDSAGAPATAGARTSVVWSAHKGGAGSSGTAGIVMVRFQGAQKDVQRTRVAERLGFRPFPRIRELPAGTGYDSACSDAPRIAE